MGGSLGFVFSLVLAIAAGVLANLLTPWVRQLAANRSTAFMAKLVERREQEKAFIKWLAQNPQALQAHLVDQRTRLNSLAIGFTGIAILATSISQLDPTPSLFGQFTLGISTLTMAWLGYQTSRTKNKINRIWTGVLRETGWMDWDLTVWSNDHNRWLPINSPKPDDGGAEHVSSPRQRESSPPP